MNEFITKLIERLEEEKDTAYKTYTTFEMKVDLGRTFGIEKTIEIINQLAERSYRKISKMFLYGLSILGMENITDYIKQQGLVTCLMVNGRVL